MDVTTKLSAYVSVLLPTALLPLLASCGDAFTGPEPASVPEDPSYIALLLSAVQTVRLDATLARTSEGTPYILTIQGMLHPDGRASGFISLVDPDDPSRRVHYVLREWTGECEGDTPMLHLSGFGHAVPSASAGGTFTHRFSFGFDLEPRKDARSGQPVLQLTWTVSDPAGREGEYIMTEVGHAADLSDLCEAR